MTTEAPLFCYIHPDRETGLLCSQCERPICGQCAVPGPVGQLCPQCRRGRRPANYQVSARDVAIAFPVAFATSAGIGWVVNTFLGTGGFLLILLFAVGPGIAELIVRAVERTTRMKRGRAMQITVGLAIVLGALAAWLLRPIFPPLALLLFTILAVSTAATRLR